jgi:hypothetical protein
MFMAKRTGAVILRDVLFNALIDGQCDGGPFASEK